MERVVLGVILEVHDTEKFLLTAREGIFVTCVDGVFSWTTLQSSSFSPNTIATVESVAQDQLTGSGLRYF